MKFDKFIKLLLSTKKPLLAVLIDPDKFNLNLVTLASSSNVSCFLVGGSQLNSGNISIIIKKIKSASTIPVILFPGDETQLNKNADGLLLLSLLSGRNPDYLIEKHIAAAPLIKKMKLRCFSTAYLLIGKTNSSTTQLVTKTKPLNESDPSYIINTALAAQQLGFKAIYLEAGSGATSVISTGLIKKIKKNVSLPIIVGGGIDSVQKLKKVISSNPQLIVVGNAFEKDVNLLAHFSPFF
jgi:phosphoglycerol geranylgeranyltransferase